MDIFKKATRAIGGAVTFALFAPEAIGMGVAAATGAVVANIVGSASDNSIAKNNYNHGYNNGYGDGHRVGYKEGNIDTAKKCAKMMAERERNNRY